MYGRREAARWKDGCFAAARWIGDRREAADRLTYPVTYPFPICHAVDSSVRKREGVVCVREGVRPGSPIRHFEAVTYHPNHTCRVGLHVCNVLVITEVSAAQAKNICVLIHPYIHGCTHRRFISASATSQYYIPTIRTASAYPSFHGGHPSRRNGYPPRHRLSTHLLRRRIGG